MASLLRSIANEMEMSFFSVMIEASIKMSNIAESKLLIIHDSSDGSRRLAGHEDLIQSFQSGHVVPQPSDLLYDKPETSMKTNDQVRNVLKRKNRMQHETYSAKRRNRGDIFGVEEEGEEEEEEVEDVKPVLTAIDDDFEELTEDYEENGADKEIPNSSDCGEKCKTPSKVVDDSKRDLSKEVEDKIPTQLSHTLKTSENVYRVKQEKKGSFWEISSQFKSYSKDRVTRRRCNLCSGFKTYTFPAYRDHVAAVHEGRNACSLCGKGFGRITDLKRHTKKNICKDISKTSDFKGKEKVDEIAADADKNDILKLAMNPKDVFEKWDDDELKDLSESKVRIRKLCKYCTEGKTYSISEYKRHFVAVHQQKHTCPYCRKGFRCRVHVIRHIQNKVCLRHMAKKDVLIDKGQNYYDADNNDDLELTNNPEDNSVEIEKKDLGSDDYREDNFSKEKGDILNPEERSQPSEKDNLANKICQKIPIVRKCCKFCTDKKTYTASAYKDHIAAVHERLYSCSLCGKGFRRRTDLNSHVRKKSCSKLKSEPYLALKKLNALADKGKKDEANADADKEESLISPVASKDDED